MKKTFLTLVCASVSSLALFAQVQFGPKAGVGISNLAGSDLDNSTLTGFYAGAMARIPVGSKFSIQPEVIYAGQGAKFTEGSSKTTIDLHYLNVPVLANYTFFKGFYGETGPQAGFLMQAKAKNGGTKSDIKDNFKKIDFSWAFGIGYTLPFNLGINARYNLGIGDIAKDEDKIRNSVFQGGIYYLFNSKRGK